MSFGPAPPPPVDPPVSTAGSAPGPSRRRVWPWAVGILAVVLVLGAGALAAVLLLGSGNTPEQAVEDWDRAWEETDCDLYFEVTTEAYRERELGLLDGEVACDVFESRAGEWDEEVQDYVLEILGIEEEGDSAEVRIRESWYDPEFEEDVSERMTVTVEKIDGRWRLTEYE